MTRPPHAIGPVFPKLAQGKLPDAKKKDMPAGLWTKCPDCGTYIFNKELEVIQMVCKGCQHHFAVPALQRIHSLLDPQTWEQYDANLSPVDALNFTGYADQLKRYQKKTGMQDSVVSGLGRLCGHKISIAVMDFQFIGGSMGVVAGEKITRAIERATQERIPVLIFAASGGARMHEGMFSLLQMGKTSGALQRHAAKKLPFISVLTDPTMGGVTASFATLGDIIIAEPKAKIGFAGARVLRETTKQDLPKEFQTAEFLLERGLIDRIVPRHKLRAELANILSFLQPLPDEMVQARKQAAIDEENISLQPQVFSEWSTDIETKDDNRHAHFPSSKNNGKHPRKSEPPRNGRHINGNGKNNGNPKRPVTGNGHPATKKGNLIPTGNKSVVKKKG